MPSPSNNPSRTDADSATSLRLWPALGILALTLAAMAWIWLRETNDTQRQVMQSLPILFAAVLGLLLWWFFLARLSGRLRLLSLALLILSGGLGALLLEIRGVSGNLVPILGWRFAQDAPLETSGATAAPAARALSPTDFPQFMGQGRDGRVLGSPLAPSWAQTPPQELWRREIGEAWSAFAVVGKAAVTQEQRGEQELVTRYDLESGEAIWSHSVEERFATVIGGIGPRATPTIAEGRVFSLGATGVLSALDLDTGALLWSRHTQEEQGATPPQWGKSCSPLVAEDKVIVSVGAVADWSLVAYHRETGEVLWHAGSDLSSYSSPLLATLAGVTQVLIFNQGSITAHALEDGRVLWSEPWSAAQPNVAQPLVLPGDRVLTSSGYGIGSKLFQIRRDEVGAWSSETLWESRRLKAKFASPVYHEGFVYGLDDGVLTCLDPETGERRWKGGRYGHGQVLLTGNLLLVQTEPGEVVMVEATPEGHRELARLGALSSKTWNPPVLTGSTLLVRNDKEAVAYTLPTLTGAT